MNRVTAHWKRTTRALYQDPERLRRAVVLCGSEIFFGAIAINVVLYLAGDIKASDLWARSIAIAAAVAIVSASWAWRIKSMTRRAAAAEHAHDKLPEDRSEEAAPRPRPQRYHQSTH